MSAPLARLTSGRGADALARAPLQSATCNVDRDAPSGSEWIHELKYDGYRIGAIVTGARVRLESRREIDWTISFPEVVEAVRELECSASRGSA